MGRWGWGGNRGVPLAPVSFTTGRRDSAWRAHCLVRHTVVPGDASFMVIASFRAPPDRTEIAHQLKPPNAGQ